jgi:hypothetical protein
MSSVWEIVNLDPADAVTLMVNGYILTIANARCYWKPEDGVIVMLEKSTGRLRLGLRGGCNGPIPA